MASFLSLHMHIWAVGSLFFLILQCFFEAQKSPTLLFIGIVGLLIIFILVLNIIRKYHLYLLLL